jgi:hypothetical protein
MTGLAAGVDRARGEPGGGLAAMGRGFQGVTAQNQARQRVAFQQQQEMDRVTLEKAANARGQQDLIIRQHEMGRLDSQFRLEQDKFTEEKLQRLAQLRVENSHIQDNLLRLHAELVTGAPEAATDEELREWATGHMKDALGNFDTLPVQDLETGKWHLYKVPKNQEMEVHYGGKTYTVPVDPAMLVKAAQDETKDNIDRVRAEADKLRAQAELYRLEHPGGSKTVSRDVAEEVLGRVEIPVPDTWKGKDEVPTDELRQLLATKVKSPGETIKTTEPTIVQGIANVVHGRDFNAPIKSTTQTVTGPVPAHSTPPAGATGTAMGSDGKAHWTDGKNDLGVVQ